VPIPAMKIRFGKTRILAPHYQDST